MNYLVTYNLNHNITITKDATVTDVPELDDMELNAYLQEKIAEHEGVLKKQIRILKWV